MGHEEQIFAFLGQVCPFSRAELDAFVPLRQEVRVAGGSHFIQVGEVCRKIAFVHQGAFSFLLPTADGQLHIKDFSLAGKFLTAYTSLITRQPAQLTIRAETDATLSVWPVDVYDRLTEEHLLWSRFSRKMADYLFLRKEQRELSLLLETAEQRYERLLQEFPQIQQAVPQYLIAAYLGIQPETLSRIRRRRATDGS